MDANGAVLPILKDLNIQNITSNVNIINSRNPDARSRFVLGRLTKHLHDFAREVQLSSQEWMAAIQFLTQVGQICTDVRQEFILLSDVFGLSLLVDSIDHPKPDGATEGTVLGPFHTHDAEKIEHGELLSHDSNGEPLLVICTVKDQRGQPIADVTVDIWETDSSGHYDVQYADRITPDGRCIIKTNEQGHFWFKGIVPVSYPIPHDGPVGQLLQKLKRHPMRPGHMHFMFEKQGWDPLITALYIRGDPYESSDAVFGVKDSLIVDLVTVDDETAGKYQVDNKSKVLRYDFVLVTSAESEYLRQTNSRKAFADMGYDQVKMVDGLPVPEVD